MTRNIYIQYMYIHSTVYIYQDVQLLLPLFHFIMPLLGPTVYGFRPFFPAPPHHHNKLFIRILFAFAEVNFKGQWQESLDLSIFSYPISFSWTKILLLQNVREDIKICYWVFNHYCTLYSIQVWVWLCWRGLAGIRTDRCADSRCNLVSEDICELCRLTAFPEEQWVRFIHLKNINNSLHKEFMLSEHPLKSWKFLSKTIRLLLIKMQSIKDWLFCLRIFRAIREACEFSILSSCGVWLRSFLTSAKSDFSKFRWSCLTKNGLPKFSCHTPLSLQL